MTKHDFIFSHGVYFFLGLLVLTYAVFPSAYTRASQMLFTALYAYHAPSVTPAPHGDAARAAADEPAVRLHTVARPPQTPYDSMLMTAPEGTGGESPVGRYVYGNGVPVGYVDGRRGSLYVVILFSSSLSGELFSVAGYVTEGIGSGGGSFSLQMPLGHAVSVGTPIVHQATGETVSRVAVIETIAEKNIIRVGGVIGINPLETAELSVPRGGAVRITPEERAAVLEDMHTPPETADGERRESAAGTPH